MCHPEINPVMLIICPSGRSFEVAVTNSKQASIIRRVKKSLDTKFIQDKQRRNIGLEQHLTNLWCSKIRHCAAWKTGTNVPEKPASSILRFRQSSNLTEEAEYSFETLVPIYKSTWHHITDIQSETLITPYMLLLLLILCHLIYQ